MTGEELKAARKGAGLTQQELATAIGMTQTYVGLMERGEAAIERRTELAVRYITGAEPDTSADVEVAVIDDFSRHEVIGGYSRQLAVIGSSDKCIATHPGDMAQALRVLDAVVETVDARGEARSIPIADFHRLPGDTPQIDTNLAAGEIVTAVTLPRPLGGRHFYRKVRDRASYAFALVSVAAVIQRDGSGRVAFGGVAHKPWRVEAAEGAMRQGARAVAAQAFAGARPTEHNAFKIPLAERALAAVMTEARA